MLAVAVLQPCADHDRASGEGVGPQEYTLIKMQVLELKGALAALEGTAQAAAHLLHGAGGVVGLCLKSACWNAGQGNVFLLAATLRPETMYGQTNCFVLPEGDYGAYEVVGGDVLIVSERAARGLAYQSLTPEWGVAKSLVNLKGSDLLGLPLKAPNATYERVYTLPLMTISMGKGTGVVTSVPSDAPDDYAALKELKDKPLWREKFGLTADMVDPFDVVPIIGT